MGLTDVLRTARDALAAQTLGLSVTGQNVSNVNTPGYVRREAILQATPLGNQSFGTVSALGIRRVADTYAEQRHYAAVGLSSGAQTSDQLLGQLEAMFDVTSGLNVGGAFDELTSAFSTLSTDPSNLAVRETVLGKAAAFTARLNDTANSVAAFRSGLAQQAVGVASDVNQLTTSIAKITEKITQAEILGNDAADLKDQRDGLLMELSEFVDVRVFSNNKGQLVVQGAGTTLVEGSVARSLDVGLAPDGTLRVLAKSQTGATTNVSSLVQSGKLGALKELHDTHAQQTLSSLDQYALDIATAVNSLHTTGYSLDGSAGVDFFDVSAGPAGLARTLQVNASLTASGIAASATSTGVPGDGANALALAQLREQDVGTGTRTPVEAYGDIVRDVGARRQAASHDAEIREGMENQTFAMRESIGGVSLDEEMVSLSKYQHAYEAASRVIATIDGLLEDLIHNLKR